MRTPLLVPIRYVDTLLEMMTVRGVETGRLLAAARISAASLGMRGAGISIRQLDRLLMEACRLTKRDDIGLDLGLRIPSTAHEMLGLAQISARTVGASLRLTARYYPLISGHYSMHYERRPEAAVVTFLANFPVSQATRQLHADILAGSFHAQLTLQKRARISPYRITIGVDAPRHRHRYAELSPARVTFDPDIRELLRIDLPIKEVDRRLPMANAHTCRASELACQAQLAKLSARRGWCDWVSDTIRSMENELPSLEQIAAACNCSTRTLDRRLSLEATSFRTLATAVRHAQAQELLEEENLRISEIAFRLGYGDAANFARAFRKMAGETPTSYRHRAMEAQSAGGLSERPAAIPQRG
jgi:AraC-like DNA-binding protein